MDKHTETEDLILRYNLSCIATPSSNILITFEPCLAIPLYCCYMCWLCMWMRFIFWSRDSKHKNLVSSASRKVFITTTDLYVFLILASCQPGLWFLSQCRLLHWIQWLDNKVVTLLSHFLMWSRLFCVLCQLHPSKTTVSGGLFQIQNMLGQLCL
jgi:hypothetical protein